MKTRHTILIYVFGLSFDYVGALFKILHYPGGDELLIVGTLLQIVGGLFFLYKLLTNPKTKEFLDW